MMPNPSSFLLKFEKQVCESGLALSSEGEEDDVICWTKSPIDGEDAQVYATKQYHSCDFMALMPILFAIGPIRTYLTK